MLRDFRVSRRGAAAAVVIGASALLVLPGTHAAAATVSVPCTGVNTADVAALKAAITAANIAGGQTLSLGAGCTFTLTAVDNTGSNGPNGLPQITSTMTIQGNGDTITRDTASGNTPPFRYFETTAAGNLIITDLILTKGLSGFSGGAIYGVGPVTVIGSTLSDNGSAGSGGAIYDHGALVVTNSSFLGNMATSDGGGIDSASGVVVAVNYALTVSGSTFSANTATQTGGAIRADNATVIVNSTLTGNTGFAGGGVFNHSTDLSILDSTIADNVATSTHAGGGIANEDVQASVTVTNTIVADNTDDNCGNNSLHPITDGGHNLENGTSCAFAGNAVNAEPVLGGLANNGGPTFTRAITSSSPAFSKGAPAICAAAAPDGAAGVDQRGIARKTTTPCDIGAFEVAAIASPSPTPVIPSVPPAGAVPADSPGPSAGLVIAGAGILLLGVLTAIGRRRNHSVV